MSDIIKVTDKKKCPDLECQSENVKELENLTSGSGKNDNGTLNVTVQRWHCEKCGKDFLLKLK